MGVLGVTREVKIPCAVIDFPSVSAVNLVYGIVGVDLAVGGLKLVPDILQGPAVERADKIERLELRGRGFVDKVKTSAGDIRAVGVETSLQKLAVGIGRQLASIAVGDNHPSRPVL